MILNPFTVISRGNQWKFVDRLSIDSDLERDAVQQVILGQIDLMQKDAMCAALGIKEVGAIGNLEFGVYDKDDVLTGVFLVASLDYQSGPWADLIDWEVTSSDPCVFRARPMPGFLSMDEDDALDLSVDAAHHLLFRRMTTMSGNDVEFERLSWAIFKDRTDPNSVEARKYHDKAKGDNRFNMTEAPDPNDAALTRVDIQLA